MKYAQCGHYGRLGDLDALENEYISKQAFNDAIREAVRMCPNTFYNGLEVARQIAHNMDAADVAPVVHGKWTLNKDGSGTCSECGRVQTNCWDIDNWDNFCHHCGADMRICGR